MRLPHRTEPLYSGWRYLYGCHSVEETESLPRVLEIGEKPLVADAYHIGFTAGRQGELTIELELAAGSAPEIMGLEHSVERGENVNIYISLPEKKLVMDALRAALADFPERTAPLMPSGTRP